MRLVIVMFVCALLGLSCRSSSSPAKKGATHANSDGRFDADELVEKAKKHIGTRYRTGGKEPAQGFDCSGFTCYMFGKYNVTLPPTALQQANMGWAISIREARKGDLIFFKGEKLSSSKVGHVGIVVSDAGQNPVQFIHASSSKGIMISALSESYFQKRFLKIRRVRQ